MEHTLTAVLPFGGRQESAAENMLTQLPKRLDKNKRLHQAILDGKKDIWTTEHSDLALPSISIPIEHTTIEELFTYVVRGLLLYHYKIRLSPAHTVKVIFVESSMANNAYQRLFQYKDYIINENLGEGTFVYEGVQCLEYPEATAWWFTIFGGIVLADGEKAVPGTSSHILVVTCLESDLLKAIGQYTGLVQPLKGLIQLSKGLIIRL
ncbi:MAG: hypothetical protein ACYC7E_21255 [Armatimonadota bacterium]